MSRRRHVDYDDDYYDDGYYDEKEEEDEYEDDTVANSKYVRPEGATENFPSDPSQSHLLDALVEEFRACLADASIPRDDIDAVLVAAEYNVESAIQIMREQISAAETESMQAAARLEALKPSAFARMLEVETGDEEDLPEMPVELQSPCKNPATSSGFAFDEPSPDDVVHSRKNAGRARAQAASTSGVSSGATGLKSSEESTVGGANSRRGAAAPRRVVEAKPAMSVPVGIRSTAPDDSHGPAMPTRGAAKGMPAAPVALTAPKQRVGKVKIPHCSALASRSPCISIVVAGHVDAGKSTLVGHLLRLVNAETVSGHRSAKQNEGKRRPRDASPSLSASLRFVTDQDVVEQERGVTIDFATHFFRSRKNAKTFSLVDSPGHRDYIPAMILGACQASAAILVVDASTGEFESGFSEEGQTREHAILLRSLGIRCLVVIVNKMDMVAFAQDRFDIICSELASFLKTLGWRLGKDICFVPASGLSGLNLVDGPPANGHPLAKWYTGETVLGSLEALPTATAQEIQQAMNGPTRLIVSDMFRSSTLGGVFAICGRLVSGTVAAKDQLRLSPSAEVATVKSIEAGTTARQGANAYAVAGADSLPISLGLGNVSANIVASPGDVLCDPQSPVPTVSRFRGQIVTIATPVPVMQGLHVELHLGGRSEAAVISKLVELKMQTSAKVCTTKKRPRRLMNGDSAVIEVSVLRPICVELATDVKFLGRFALRSHGKTVAAGLVTALLQDKKESRPASVAADNT